MDLSEKGILKMVILIYLNMDNDWETHMSYCGKPDVIEQPQEALKTRQSGILCCCNDISCYTFLNTRLQSTEEECSITSY